MDMKQEIVDERGFYFAVFLSDTSKNRVKVWFDGDEDYDYFSHEEFIAMASDVEFMMKRALMDYSYFLWDVKAKTVNRLRFQQDAEQIRKMLNEHLPQEEESEENTIASRYCKTEERVYVDNLSINT